MISYGATSNSLACYQQLTAATVGSALTSGGASITTKIKQLIDAAVSKIDRIEVEIAAADCGLDISFDPAPPYTSLTAPLDFEFQEQATAPASTEQCTVTAVVDGTPRAVQHWNVDVVVATTTSTTTTTTTTTPLSTGDPGPLPFPAANSGPVLLTGLALVALGAMALLAARFARHPNG
jgi:hypothetical protein